jgi:hypothetical protein
VLDSRRDEEIEMIRQLASALVVTCVVLAACDSDDGWTPPFDVTTEGDAPSDLVDGAPDGTSDPPLDTAADDGGSTDPPADGSDPADEEAVVPAVPMCLQRCSTSADCGTPTSPAYDSDNYACTDGFCVYSGCNSDTECVDSMGAGYGCSTATSIPYCTQTCSTYADCGTPSSPAYDSDNYTCTGRFCVYSGCNSDAECVDSVGAGYRCNTTMSIAYCTQSCSTYVDCGTPASPAYDSDNYDCTGGFCVYSGCNSDAECVDTLGAGHGCH